MLSKELLEINGYKVIRELSQGAISTVYMGEQTALHRPVLIKRLNTQWTKEPDLLERFRREAIICARLKHPNIVHIIDVNTQKENLYLIIEFIEGLNLEELIKSHHPIPVELILFISKKVLQGLHYAHSKGVLHRDIKPANIMISSEGRVKIADFGLAKVEDLPPISMHGEVVGTPAYMSPEQARVSKLDQRSDLFSLGVTFYELASGQPSPFQGENIIASVQKLVKLQPPPLIELRPEIPEWYSDLVDELLKKNPADRPDSAGTILELPQFQESTATVSKLANFIADPAGYQSAVTEVPVEAPRPSKPGKKVPLIALSVLAAIILVIYGMNSAFFTASKNTDPSPAEQNTLVENRITEPAQNSALPNNIQDTLLQSTPPLEKEQTLTAGNHTDAKNTDSNEHGSNQIPKQPAVEQPHQTISTVAGNTPSTSLPEKNNSTNARIDSTSLTAAPAAPGGIMVSCSPWAHVIIDGRRVDTTPLQGPIELTEGRYLLELKNPQFSTYRDTITVSGGMIDTISVKLQAQNGFVMLHVLPWAKVYIDGRYLETTPFDSPLPVPAGKHEIRLMNPAFQTLIDSVVINAGETVEKRFTLTRN